MLSKVFSLIFLYKSQHCIIWGEDFFISEIQIEIDVEMQILIWQANNDVENTMI